MGIAERPERLLILILATLFWPVSQAILAGGALLVAELSSITVVTRVYRASRILSKAESIPTFVFRPQNELSRLRSGQRMKRRGSLSPADGQYNHLERVIPWPETFRRGIAK